MARIARKDLNTPYMHVMVQGVNKEFIFEDAKLLKKYLYSILIYEDKNKFSILAYCMMNNHAHFLFYVEDIKAFEKYMHIINLKFANYYNKVKNRCGVVFRNRYQIEPIYNEGHLINCIKYIHDNPVKAEIVDSCEKYHFSSYNDYLNHTGVSLNPKLKEIFGSSFDYITILDKSFDKRFIDVDDNNINVYVEAGINEFVSKYNHSLMDIFLKRDVLKNLIMFLKDECNINIKYSCDFLGLTKSAFNRL